MKTKPLWHVSVSTSEESEDAVAILVERVFGSYPSIYTNAETKVSTLTVYVGKPARAAELGEIRSSILGLGTFGFNTGRTTIKCGRVRREDWSRSWKKYFKNIEVGGALLIRPSWSRRLARRGQAVVVLDPGLSFGTGQHPTTAFCLEHLVKLRRRDRRQSVLDVGCGSGILAISAVKLGYRPVRGFDFDPVAVRVAKANAQRNRVRERVAVSRADLTKTSKTTRVRYDVVCANLIDDLLVDHAARIVNRVKPFGHLVVAGVLNSQFLRVREAYERLGLVMAAVHTRGEWTSAAFLKGKGTV